MVSLPKIRSWFLIRDTTLVSLDNINKKHGLLLTERWRSRKTIYMTNFFQSRANFCESHSITSILGYEGVPWKKGSSTKIEKKKSYNKNQYREAAQAKKKKSYNKTGISIVMVPNMIFISNLIERGRVPLLVSTGTIAVVGQNWIHNNSMNQAERWGNPV